MFLSARRVVVGAIGSGAVAAAMLLTGAPSAIAAPPPPFCTAADLAGTSSSVSAATPAYLHAHPAVNDFFTSLHGTPREDVRVRVRQYLDANPQTKSELTAIRQPLVDIKNRCGTAIDPALPGN
jgi:hemophore-related protein